MRQATGAVDQQLDIARRAIHLLNDLLTDQRPQEPATAPKPGTDQPADVAELTGTGEFMVAVPNWAAAQRLEPQEVQYVECAALSPAEPRTQDAAAAAAIAVTNALGELPAGGGVLVVGHMPQISWLGYQLTRGFGGRWWKPWNRAALPLAPGEIACLAVTQRWGRWSGHLLWAITPNDDEALKSLYEKVRSPMTGSRVPGAVTWSTWPVKGEG